MSSCLKNSAEWMKFTSVLEESVTCLPFHAPFTDARRVAMRLIAYLTFIYLVTLPVCAEDLSFSSSDKRVTVVELFTSQGCSSCPPAEMWLNNFKSSPELWRDLVPLAWHVDYWDRLGWRDSFALAEYSHRQYRYKEDGNIRSVYTPSIIVNGKEWRRWLAGYSPSTGTEPAGRLHLRLNGNRLSGAYQTDSASPQDYRLSIAVLGSDLRTKIAEGENRGRELTQEFVVLGHKTIRSEDGNKWQTDLPRFSSHPGARYALAAWVSLPESQTPLQASGGWLPLDLLEGRSLTH